VIFDLHATLIHAGDPADWMTAALTLMQARGADPTELELPSGDQLAPWALHIWDHAREIDPRSDRDLSPHQHRAVYDQMIERTGIIPTGLADALYRTMLDQWQAYQESAGVLAALRDRGLRIGILSNIGIDPRGVLERTGLAGRYDAEVFSFEVGVVKPDAEIFRIAAERLGLAPLEVLMVGDSVEDDGGAAHIGMRTLILPRTAGPTHGLEQVLRLVG